jgi:hypothetical protein
MDLTRRTFDTPGQRAAPLQASDALPMRPIWGAGPYARLFSVSRIALPAGGF